VRESSKIKRLLNYLDNSTLEEADVHNYKDKGMTKQTLKQNRLLLMDMIYMISELSMHKSRGQPVDTMRKSISFIPPGFINGYAQKKVSIC